MGANAVGLIDVGCSAGLNLNVDRVGITYSNGQSLGDPRPTVAVELADEERETLVRSSRRRSSSQALALRSRIVLACADGGPNTKIADDLGCDRGHGRQVALPVRRGGAGGLAGAPIWAPVSPALLAWT